MEGIPAQATHREEVGGEKKLQREQDQIEHQGEPTAQLENLQPKERQQRPMRNHRRELLERMVKNILDKTDRSRTPRRNLRPYGKGDLEAN